MLPLAGGLPKRLTWSGDFTTVVGWTPGSHILYASGGDSTLPSEQLVDLDPATAARTAMPLAQASDGVLADDGTLYFTRLPFQGSHTRRYKGGTAQNLWKFAKGGSEATPLTADYDGTSKAPMLWQGRLYFASDRDGTMNLWSMRLDGTDLKQLTRHADYDVQSPSLSQGRIAYQLGADIRIYDIQAASDRVVPITLVSDFDQMRERWVDNPTDWITSAHLSPTGDRVALTARGQLYVLPAADGRIVEASRGRQARWRNGRFMPDGKALVGLSDQSGEVEFWTTPANGVGAAAQITNSADVLRWDGLPSPDGKLLAHRDKNQRLWVLDVAKKTETRVVESQDGDIDDLAWSPDSRFLAYTVPDTNLITRIYLWNSGTGTITPVTTDRYDSYSPAWAADSRWLYFISDRTFASVVGSPWGTREPEPFFDKQAKVYHVALVPSDRSPFRPADELYKPEEKKDEAKKDEDAKKGKEGKEGDKADAAAVKPAFTPDLAGIETRLIEVPLPANNYNSLSLDDKRLYVLTRDSDRDAKPVLKTLALDNKKPEAETFLENVASYELSADRKKILLRRDKDFFIVDAGAKAPGELTKFAVPLKSWRMHFDVREEWQQMFVEAWRLERDYFYDRGMHGVDWKAVRAKYEPLAARVTDRDELSDVLAQMVSELSALHIFVYGGDAREGQQDIAPGSLGARLVRDEAAGGFRVDYIFKTDPDRPDRTSPLARPGVDVHEGDVIEQVNGVPALSVADPGQLLRGQADHQVLLRVKAGKGGAERDVIATPITPRQASGLRYDDWEYTRRVNVERDGQGQIGYVHLRAMGSGDMAQWTREFYPVFNRAGLIIDVRHNNGGNIDPWLLSRLMRKAWFYWQPRVGHPYWNMQFAFRGHVVVLIDEETASDGEAFSEGFRRLGLGKLIGTRTWGGEIWLSSSNNLVDRGIATAAEFGVYGPEGAWLIEGHGVDPDIIVDNLPHATYQGGDAQLDAAIKFLAEQIKSSPVPVPPAPPYPIKRLTPGAAPPK